MITGSTKDNNSKKVDEVKEIKIHLEFFAVRSKTGQYFRAVGFGGGGKHWVDEIGDAKIYAKIGGAMGRVTYFINQIFATSTKSNSTKILSSFTSYCKKFKMNFNFFNFIYFF
jgi:hypothetical protein